jgi:hypothetical protein
MDHKSSQGRGTSGEHDVPQELHSDEEHHVEHDRGRMPQLERRQSGDRSKRLPVDVDADSSRGDPPHGYGTEAPQVQGGGKR